MQCVAFAYGGMIFGFFVVKENKVQCMVFSAFSGFYLGVKKII